MANGLQLAWMDVGSTWVPSQPFPMRLRLMSSGKAEGIQQLRGPNPALGFAVYRDGETPRWHAGAEAAAMAGIEGSQGMVAVGTLAAGASWETTEDLNQYWLPPAPGRYWLAGRYLTPAGAAETAPQALEVAPAGLIAADSTMQNASELLLAQAWGDAGKLWLRLASGGFPLAPRWLFPAGNWSGKGAIRVAQQAFSPEADPPLASYRFWLVWLSGSRLAGCLMNYEGKQLAQFQEDLKTGKGLEILTPVQMENAELCVPVVNRAGKKPDLVWYRIGAGGGRAAEWARWPMPQDAQPAQTTASPSGSVALLCLDSSHQNISGFLGALQTSAPPIQPISHFDKGRIVYSTVLDLRDGISLLLVRALDQEARSVSVHQRGAGRELNSGAVAIPARIKPKDFCATWIDRAGTVLVMRDETDRLWVTSPDGGSDWRPVEGLRASHSFGVTGNLSGAVVWAADAVLGLRFQRAMLF